MKTLKTEIEFFLPLVLGLYCLIQGAALAFSANAMIQLMGMGLWLWLPGCTYYSWRGYKALAAANAAAAEHASLHQAELQDEEEHVLA
jgi:hypothetical protein